jgi:Domain of unknown function (DUF4383)
VGTALSDRYAVVAGAILALLGIAGFFYSSDFGSPGDVESMFGLFDVNGWLNLVHILTGAAGLIAFAAGTNATRWYALGAGAFYLVLAIWGFVVGAGDSILGIVPVGAASGVLQLCLGLAGIAAALVPRSKLEAA